VFCVGGQGIVGSRVRLFIQLAEYFRQEWRRYLGAILLLIIIALIQLIPPRLVGVIVDGVTRHALSQQRMLLLSSAIVLIALLIYLLRYVWRTLLFGAAYHLAVKLREKYYLQLSRQSPAFYHRYRTGDLLARATNDVDRVVMAAGEGVLTLVDSMVMGIAVIIMMSTQISWQLTFLALLPMPVMAVIINRIGQQLHLGFTESQAAFSQLNDKTQQMLTGIRLIKSFGLENYQSEQFQQITRFTGEKNQQVAKIDASFEPVIYLSIASANFIAIAGGCYMVWHNIISFGQLTSFIMYLGLMIWPMLALAWMFNIVERGSAALSRIDSLLAEPISISAGVSNMDPKPANLVANIGNFNYPEQTQIQLRGPITFSLHPNEFLGICGPTGAGKSTLLALLQRQYDLPAEQLNYADRPISEWKLDEWRQRLAVVNQSPFLFSESIAGNIALGKPDATMEEIETVAKLASIHEDILRFPAGYQTEVGERGIRLSGGQKQRICLARALLMQPEILILDDALSAVDGATEFAILKNLKQQVSCTLIVTAHRLSVIAGADEILVLDQGSIIQRGNFTSLKAAPGWFQNMLKFQQMESNLVHQTGSENV
jgi:ATP-binding cassette, subfamily B, multidrug efflux pump